MGGEDRVYREPRDRIVDFAFDETVAEVFPDMIRRSVPGYDTVIPVTGLLAADALAEAGDGAPMAYDLGCSLGATTLAMLRQAGDRPCRIAAVDAAAAMIDRARSSISDPRVEFIVSDVRDLTLEPCRVVVLNYVLQFLPPSDRLPLLERIRQALDPGGLLVLSEKVRFDDPDLQREFEAAHLAFKRANGYSELEISQKRTALENVMIVDTPEQHRERLQAAGFGTIRQWYQWLNWASFQARP